MHKILLIAKREFLTRVRKKSFVLMTLLSPLLILLFYGVIFYLNIKNQSPEKIRKVLVVDDVHFFKQTLPTEATIAFEFGKLNKNEFEKELANEQYDLILNVSNDINGKAEFYLYSLENVGFVVKEQISRILSEQVQQKTFIENGIAPELINQVKHINIDVKSILIKDHNATANHSEMGALIGFILAFVIYIFIFLYGVQVMRGAIEEKSSRIVEILVSSIKATDLMYGKIIGIAAVGMTQFIIWIILGLGLMGPLSGFIGQLVDTNLTGTIQDNAQIQHLSQNIGLEWLFELNLPMIFVLFICYFVGGYLFYGALFAAIGAAVDNDTDTQQFMMPITMPLVFSLIYSQSMIGTNPDGLLTTILSMLPFTSPVIMMVRIPYGVPTIELISSLLCLSIGFILSVWFAGKIYRVGLLSYGNKITYKSFWKMFRQKE
jgi:ABC-2 type transport system permease protein